MSLCLCLQLKRKTMLNVFCFRTDTALICQRRRSEEWNRGKAFDCLYVKKFVLLPHSIYFVNFRLAILTGPMRWPEQSKNVDFSGGPAWIKINKSTWVVRIWLVRMNSKTSAMCPNPIPVLAFVETHYASLYELKSKLIGFVLEFST